jgi:hypothetical protein
MRKINNNNNIKNLQSKLTNRINVNNINLLYSIEYQVRYNKYKLMIIKI